MKAQEKRVAARLISSGDLTEAELERAISEYTGKVPLHDLLVSRGYVSSKAATRVLAEVEGYQFIELAELRVSEEATKLISPDDAWRYEVLPIWKEDGCITVAICDPSNVFAQDVIRLKAGCPVVTLIAERQDLRDSLSRVYGPSPAQRAAAKEPAPPAPPSTGPNLAGISPPSARRREYAPPPPPPPEEEKAIDQMATLMFQMPRIDLEEQIRVSKEDVSRLPTKIEELTTRIEEAEEVPPPPVPEPDDQLSSSDRHRMFQRQMRQLRDSDSNGQGISHAATKFEPATTGSLTEIETKRVELGSYEAPKDTPEAPITDSATPALLAIKKLFAAATDDRAEELELVIHGGVVRARMRLHDVWRPAPAYDVKLHGSIVNRLRLMAGVELKQRDVALQHQFLMHTKRGDSVAVLHVEPAQEGDRVVIRFPENQPLIANPLRHLGLDPVDAAKLHDRMIVRGGGLLFLTSPSARTLQHLYNSFLRSFAAVGSRDILSLERVSERRLPGVTPINCPTEEVLLASLANSAFMNPDLLAIASVESGTALNKALNVAIRGTTVLACLTLPEAIMAESCFRAALLDPMNVVRGTVGHIHVEEVPRLCNSCAKPITDLESLPEWAAELESQFFEKGEGESCQGTGYSGSLFLTDFRVPDTNLADGSMKEVFGRKRDIVAASLAGEIDPRTHTF